MSEFVTIFVNGVMDAIEEFFGALVIPTRRYTLSAFFVSLGFLAWSVVAAIFELPAFIGWQEAVTCSVLMLIIVLIDSSTRSAIKGNLSKVRSVTARFSYAGDEEESDEDNEEYDEPIIEQEVIEDESGQQ